MIRILTLVVSFVFLCTIASGQEIKKGGYYANAANKKFKGTWVYIHEKDTFKVVLTESKKVYSEYIGIYSDFINGKYSYVKAGVRVADYMNDPQFLIVNCAAGTRDPATVKGYFVDRRKNKRGELRMQFLDEENKLLRWTLRNAKRERKGGLYADKSFSVPEDMILEKAD